MLSLLNISNQPRVKSFILQDMFRRKWKLL